MTSEYPDYDTPQQHATTISNTGVPLLARPANLISQSGTVGSGGIVTVASNLPISKIGYEISLTWNAPATNQSIITMTLTWIDSVSGQTVITDTWDFYAGSGTVLNAHIIRGSGPTKGDTLTVQAQQNASTVTAQYTIVMAQNSRVYLRDDWRTVKISGVTGITGGGNIFPQNGILSNVDSLAVAAGGSVTSLIALYSGRIVLAASSGSGTSDCQNLILDNTTAAGGLQQNQVVRGKTDSNGNLLIVSAVLPRSQCLIQQINNNAAAKDLLTFITVAEY